jgi:hypothetical protein
MQFVQKRFWRFFQLTKRFWSFEEFWSMKRFRNISELLRLWTAFDLELRFYLAWKSFFSCVPPSSWELRFHIEESSFSCVSSGKVHLLMFLSCKWKMFPPPLNVTRSSLPLHVSCMCDVPRHARNKFTPLHVDAWRSYKACTQPFLSVCVNCEYDLS